MQEQSGAILSPERTREPALDCAGNRTLTDPRAASPIVSVCIANWNCREMLRGCLRSLLAFEQDATLEVIVVDNASSDGAAEMVAREFPQVRLLCNIHNAGFSRANNQAAQIARGEYLFFLNNDTLVPPGTLGRLVAFLEDHPSAAIVGPLLRDGNGKVQASHRRKPTVATFLHRTLLLRWTGLFRRGYKSYRRRDAVADRQELPVDVLMGAALLMRRDRFQELGGWDEDFTFGGEDMDLCARAGREGDVLYAPEIEITHFGRAATRQAPAYTSTHIAVGFAKYFRKTGASRWSLLGYKLAITLDAPLQILVRGSQYLLRKLTGRTKKAEQSLTALRGIVPFLFKGLVKFWRA